MTTNRRKSSIDKRNFTFPERMFIKYQNLLIPSFVGISLLLLFCSFQYFSGFKSAWQHQNLSTKEIEEIEMPNIARMLQSIDFEVFGNVQGVFFRKYTREKGKELGLKGWVMNTNSGTVMGTAQGEEEKLEEMKDWLKRTGSPMSKIEKCTFRNQRHLSKEEFTDFFIKKGVNYY